ncbi:MAG: ATP-binding protein [Rhodobacteraceae bacterium]|nr:ATP-binding protein [Paracoccaceae bacterium]
MRSSTGRWVSGEDFFDREADLGILKRLVQDRNHVLLTGQRRMGKTSVVQELGRQLTNEEWIFLFSDVEGATCPEDAVAEIARAAHSVQPIASRFAANLGRLFKGGVEEISAFDFRIKIRAELDTKNWRRHGEKLLRDCASQKQPALLVLDELPIFLKRMLSRDNGAQQVEVFLSWFRGVLQDIDKDSLVLIVSGSVGLEPLVRRLGISDRINHFYPYRLKPWDRDTSIGCFELLAKIKGLSVEGGVAQAVYDALGLGIPHHVQSFFARLCDFTAMHTRDRITVGDVDKVYRTELLGPSGQSDLVHYESRLKEALEGESYTLAMQILAEAATQGVFTPAARQHLELKNAPIMEDAPKRIIEAVEVLEFDGYLEAGDEGHRFSSHLLKDWWAARFRDHHTPLDSHAGGDESEEQV